MPTDIKDLDPNKNYTWDPEVNDWVEEKNIGSEKWYTIKTAAKVAGYSENTIRKAIKVGHLPANDTGTKYLISENDLKSWVENTDAHKRGGKGRAKEKTRITLLESDLKKMLMHAFNAGYECGLNGGKNMEVCENG